MRFLHLTVILIAGFVSSSCGQKVTHSQSYSEDEMRAMAQSVDEQLIVDCLPPPQVRARGGSVYLRSSRPLRTTVKDCRYKGGEYTVNANRATRLAVWLTKADGGDAEAQTNVGEIYEKDLDVIPDYFKAAKWYRKAADQGFNRAQNNLGFLYEKGLGVPKDSQQALKWYRRAAGLNAIINLNSEDIRELTTLRNEISLKTRETENLRQQLEEAQKQLDKINTKEPLVQQSQAKQKTLLDQNKEYIGRIAQLTGKIKTLEDELEYSNQSQEKETELRKEINHKTLETEQLREQLAESREQLRRNQVDIDMAKAQQSQATQAELQEQNERIAQLSEVIRQLTIKLESKDIALKEDITRVNKVVWDSVDFGNYYALIIGNAKYKSLSSLKTPINDAIRLDNILKTKYGFKTQLLQNATRTEILDALGKYRDSLSDKDSLLIFYAGHGTLTVARGHWQGINSTAKSESDWISNQNITDQLEQMDAKHVLVVVDSCYSGSISRGAIEELDPAMREAERLTWVKRKAALISRIAITSGGLKPVPDGQGRHSVFAHTFMQYLERNDNILPARSMFEVIEPQIIQRAKDNGDVQTPEYARLENAGDENGEFIFKPRNASARHNYFRLASLMWKKEHTGKAQ